MNEQERHLDKSDAERIRKETVKMSEHPPTIEGNTFKRFECGDYTYWAHEHEPIVKLEEDYNADRHMIACYWRCVWLDEARRLEAMLDASEAVKTMGIEGNTKAVANYHTANTNELAWRIWGAQN